MFSRGRVYTRTKLYTCSIQTTGPITAAGSAHSNKVCCVLCAILLQYTIVCVGVQMIKLCVWPWYQSVVALSPGFLIFSRYTRKAGEPGTQNNVSGITEKCWCNLSSSCVNHSISIYDMIFMLHTLVSIGCLGSHFRQDLLRGYFARRAICFAHGQEINRFWEST